MVVTASHCATAAANGYAGDTLPPQMYRGALAGDRATMAMGE